MSSADLSRQLLAILPKKKRTHIRETSRGKIKNLHPIYLHHLLCRIRVALGLRFALQTHPTA